MNAKDVFLQSEARLEEAAQGIHHYDASDSRSEDVLVHRQDLSEEGAIV